MITTETAESAELTFNALRSGMVGKPPVKLTETARSGRGLVATKDLGVGETVFEDEALVFGPTQGQPNPVCAACHEDILPNEVLYFCEACEVVLCSRQCKLSRNGSNHCKDE